MVADLRLDLGRRRAPADHLVGAGLGQGIAAELAGAAPDRLEQEGVRLLAQAGALQVVTEISFEFVVAGHLMPLAALLVQPQPEPALLHEHVLDPQAERRADAGEGINHEANQRPVAEARYGRDFDRVQELARLVRRQHRRLALLDRVTRTADGRGWIEREHAAGGEPVQHLADGGQALLHGWGRVALLQLLDIGRDDEGVDGADVVHAARLQPLHEIPDGARIGAPRVRVPDLRHEELKEAIRGLLARRGNQRRGVRADGDEMVHTLFQSSLRLLIALVDASAVILSCFRIFAPVESRFSRLMAFAP